jgi:spoIIIJ-associated protein
MATQPKKVKEVEAIVKELFSNLNLNSKVQVSEDKDNEAILVDIDSENESGLLIGARGETLNSIQTIIGMIYRKNTGDWQRIIVNVADWREKQNERLEQLAIQAAQRAKETGEDQNLYNLNSSERRIIHMTLAEDKEIETESVGEGRERFLKIKTKK